MHISIYSIQNTLFEGEVEKLIAKTPLGEITVLDNHLPLITLIEGPSVIAFSDSGKKTAVPINSGMLEVRPKSEVVVLAEQ